MECGEYGDHLEDVFARTGCAEEQEQEIVTTHLHPLEVPCVLEIKWIL